MVLLLIGAGWIPFASAPLTFYGMRENPLKMGQTVAGLEVAFHRPPGIWGGHGKFYQMGVVDKKVDVLMALEVIRTSR
ncbi:MAG: hypothetical protein ACLFTB_08840 [Desulfovibrionales bacterium]